MAELVDAINRKRLVKITARPTKDLSCGFDSRHRNKIKIMSDINDLQYIDWSEEAFPWPNKEVWEAAKPKLPDSNNWGVPMIFGTGGEHFAQQEKAFNDIWECAQVSGYGGKDLGPGISERFQKGEKIYGEAINLEDIEAIHKSRRVGFDSMMYDVKLKDQTLAEAESKIWMPDVPRPKRGSNYTKPKNRKKKK